MIRRVSASGKPNGVVEMRRERRSGNQHSEGENHSSIVPVCSGAGYRIKSFDVSKYRYRTFDISHLISYRKFRYLEISACKYFDSLLYVLRIVMLLLFSATLGGGLHWRDTRAAAPAAASRLLSYCQNPGTPPPSRLVGALTHAVSGDRDPQW